MNETINKLKIPRLTEKDLEILKGKKVLLYGWDGSPVRLYKILKHFNIEVIGLCGSETYPISRHFALAYTLNGIRCISPKKLPTFLKRHSNVILLKLAFEAGRLQKMEQEAKQLGLPSAPFLASQIEFSFLHLSGIKSFEHPVKYPIKKALNQFLRYFRMTPSWWRYLHSGIKEPIIICAPTKTADHSLQATFDIVNQKQMKIPYMNLWHRPHLIYRRYCEKQLGVLKIAMGVRDPIAQNVSMLYQMISNGIPLDRWFFRDLKNQSSRNKKELLLQYKSLCTEHSDDAQAFWTQFTNIYLNTPNASRGNYDDSELIQLWLSRFEKYILDITAYPFDQEKGYAIIKKGNTEVFVYQLEKLSTLAPELSAWVGVPFNEIVNANQASDKWIGECYKQAQKELKITQEYFDRCFDEPYVKHCYSESDIEKFKAKWRPNIQS